MANKKFNFEETVFAKQLQRLDFNFDSNGSERSRGERKFNIGFIMPKGPQTSAFAPFEQENGHTTEVKVHLVDDVYSKLVGLQAESKDPQISISTLAARAIREYVEKYSKKQF